MSAYDLARRDYGHPSYGRSSLDEQDANERMARAMRAANHSRRLRAAKAAWQAAAKLARQYPSEYRQSLADQARDALRAVESEVAS